MMRSVIDQVWLATGLMLAEFGALDAVAGPDPLWLSVFIAVIGVLATASQLLQVCKARGRSR